VEASFFRVTEGKREGGGGPTAPPRGNQTPSDCTHLKGGGKGGRYGQDQLKKGPWSIRRRGGVINVPTFPAEKGFRIRELGGFSENEPHCFSWKDRDKRQGGVKPFLESNTTLKRVPEQSESCERENRSRRKKCVGRPPQV